MVNSTQAEAQPERSLEIATAKKTSLGEGRLWQIIIKLFQLFHIPHSLPFREGLGVGFSHSPPSHKQLHQYFRRTQCAQGGLVQAVVGEDGVEHLIALHAVEFK